MASLSKNMIGGDPVLPGAAKNENSVLPPASPVHFPLPAFAQIRQLKNGLQLPQAIAHRGYRSKYPENSMAAFRGAVEIGSHALETDIHLSKDGVVVLSHDPTLKRCFDKEDKIIDCEWTYISSLKTTQEPHESMPRLKDLLDYLAEPEHENIWVLLDIKLDNNADDVMRLIAETIESVQLTQGPPWEERVVLGIWAAKYVALCERYLPGFPISYIGFSLIYARQFFRVENASFNMLQWSLMGPLGPSFIKKANRLKRAVFAWTVNEEKNMQWCIEHRLDGVISDDPKKFLDVCDAWEKEPKLVRWTLREWLGLLRFQVLIGIYFFIFRWRVGSGVDKKYMASIRAEGKKER